MFQIVGMDLSAPLKVNCYNSELHIESYFSAEMQMQIACYWGQVVALEMLIKAGVDVNKCSQGQTAMYCACHVHGFEGITERHRVQKKKIITALLSAGVEIPASNASMSADAFPMLKRVVKQRLMMFVEGVELEVPAVLVVLITEFIL